MPWTLRRVLHATGQHYLVGDPTQVRSIECSADAVAEFVAEGTKDVAWHTNHPLASAGLAGCPTVARSRGTSYGPVRGGTHASRVRQQCGASQLLAQEHVAGMNHLQPPAPQRRSRARGFAAPSAISRIPIFCVSRVGFDSTDQRRLRPRREPTKPLRGLTEEPITMAYALEPLRDEHRKAVIDIFNHYIARTFAAYPDGAEVVGYESFDRFLAMSRGYPAIAVTDDAGVVVGFAFLHAYRPGRAFRRSAELTCFILPEHTRRGIGTAILERFTSSAKELGIRTLLASVSSRNEGSLAFHRGHGFVECGRLRRIGEKFGEAFDIVWMQLDL
jgi:L-amino acid N-acyltransferase YncA